MTKVRKVMEQAEQGQGTKKHVKQQSERTASMTDSEQTQQM